MSECVPKQGDLWRDLEHPQPEHAAHTFTGDNAPRRQSVHRAPKAATPADQSHTSQDKTLRRRSTFERSGAFRSPDAVVREKTDHFDRLRQAKDEATIEAYRHAEDLPSARQLGDQLLTNPTILPAQPQRGYPKVEENTIVTPSDRAQPFRRPSRKQSVPGINAHEGSSHGSSTKQSERRRSNAIHDDEGSENAGSRALNPNIAYGREDHKGTPRSFTDRLTRTNARSSPYLRRPDANTAPSHDNASTDFRSVLRHADSQPLERSNQVSPPQFDYRTGLKPHTPATRESLKRMQSTPVLRKVPEFAKDHSRHRSPGGLSSYGYDEPEGTQKVTSISQTAIPEVRPSSNVSRRESYHTAESYTPDSQSNMHRRLRRIADSKANLRNSASTSARSSEVATALPSAAPSGTGTATPSTGPGPRTEDVAASVMSVTSPQSAHVQQRRSDHDCE